MGRTTISIKDETKRHLIKVRGKMELKNGKRRSIEGIINELINYYEGGKSNA